ncbi:hypothetical protein RRG08_024385 [Elysia crispata]|uniref:Uncharacterized protein n=1 Tax=Elysia crispata TaxID=231223 RepID=A0AAE0ZLC2_9GAST|nr:hypothetical protein RRG08_024385 [Elysia crispata]
MHVKSFGIDNIIWCEGKWRHEQNQGVVERYEKCYAPSQLVSDNRPREDVTQSVKPTQQKGKGHRRSYSVEA